MGELGKLLPKVGNLTAKEWRVPILVFDQSGDVQYEVVEIYEDEGYLCIDVKELENA